MEADDAIKKAAVVVPGIYYDLIARVCPGAAFLALAMWGRPTAAAELERTTGFLLFLLLIGGGYIAGLLLTAVSSVIFFFVFVPLSMVSRKTRFLHPHAFLTRLDEIDKKDDRAGATLTKMYAEMVLAQNLVTGYLLLQGAHWFKLVSPLVLPTLPSPEAMLILLLLVLCFAHRATAFLHRQHVLSRISDLKGTHAKRSA